MKHRIKAIHLIVILGMFSLVKAQSSFLRPSMSLIEIVPSGEKTHLQLLPQHIPSAFDYNKINTKHIFLGGDAELSMEAIARVISQRNIGSKAVLSVLPIREGKFSNEVVKSRGAYSATDAQVNAIKGTQNTGFANSADNFGSLGIQQLDRIYVLVFRVKDYKETNTQTEWKCSGQISFYLVKIDNALGAYHKYKSNPEQLRDSHWSGKVVHKGTFKNAEVIGKDDDNNNISDVRQQFSKNVQLLAFQSVLKNIETFQVKSTLIALPNAKWTAKLGTKEGLKIDSRFYVYEYYLKTINENGKQKDTLLMKRKSQLRVKSVGNNKGISDGNSESSVFYKIAGRPIKEGMLVRKAIGGNTGITFGYGTMQWLRIDQRIKGIYPGFKIFSGINDPSKYIGELMVEGSAVDYTAFSLDFGIEMAIILNSRIQILPFFGVGYTGLSIPNDNITLAGTSLNPGVRLALNISGSVALVSTVAYALPLGFSISHKGNDIKVSDGILSVKDPVKGQGFLWDFGLRFEL